MGLQQDAPRIFYPQIPELHQGFLKNYFYLINFKILF